MDELERRCRGKHATIISERALEVNLPPDWIDNPDLHPRFNSRYVVEARCVP